MRRCGSSSAAASSVTEPSSGSTSGTARPERFKPAGLRADQGAMRSVNGICIAMGGLLGGFAPVLWGDSGLSLAGVVMTALGGLGGLWLGSKLAA